MKIHEILIAASIMTMKKACEACRDRRTYDGWGVEWLVGAK